MEDTACELTCSGDSVSYCSWCAVVFCLTVGRPEITQPPADSEVVEGDSLHLSCASQHPHSSVWWLHNAMPVVPGESLHITGQHLMRVW